MKIYLTIFLCFAALHGFSQQKELKRKQDSLIIRFIEYKHKLRDLRQLVQLDRDIYSLQFDSVMVKKRDSLLVRIDSLFKENLKP